MSLQAQPAVVVGAEQTAGYFPLLKKKRIALFSNPTGRVGDKYLIENRMNVTAIFSPGHGFWGNMDDHFFRSYFENFIGAGYVRKMIKESKTAEEIQANVERRRRQIQKTA
jgi:uncharacterized protein YbbC (DUF1343 family)